MGVTRTVPIVGRTLGEVYVQSSRLSVDMMTYMTIKRDSSISK